MTSRLSGNRHQKVCLPLVRMLYWPIGFISTVSPLWKLLWKHRYWSCFISSKYNTCLLSHYLQKSIIICSFLSSQEYQVQIKDWLLIFYVLIQLDPGNPASFFCLILRSTPDALLGARTDAFSLLILQQTQIPSKGKVHPFPGDFLNRSTHTQRQTQWLKIIKAVIIFTMGNYPDPEYVRSEE